MVQQSERGRRWSSTGRTAAAGVCLGAAGGAITGALSLLGDDILSTGSALALGVTYGSPSGLYSVRLSDWSVVQSVGAWPCT